MDWDRPWPRPELTPELFEGKLVLVAEDGAEVIGLAFGEPGLHGRAHVNIACVAPERRRQGVLKALLAEFAARAEAAGSEHVTLDVDTTNDVGQTAWRRLGFTEYSRRLTAPIAGLAARVDAESGGESYASLHVQT